MEGFNDKEEFEKSWRSAFEDAAAEPSEEVWTRIEATLVKDESEKYRKRLIYFKSMAAASVLFALIFGAASIYYSHKANHAIEMLSEMAGAASENRNGRGGMFLPERGFYDTLPHADDGGAEGMPLSAYDDGVRVKNIPSASSIKHSEESLRGASVPEVDVTAGTPESKEPDNLHERRAVPSTDKGKGFFQRKGDGFSSSPRVARVFPSASQVIMSGERNTAVPHRSNGFHLQDNALWVTPEQDSPQGYTEAESDVSKTPDQGQSNPTGSSLLAQNLPQEELPETMTEEEALKKLLERDEVIIEDPKEEQKKGKAPLWADIKMGAGSFDPDTDYAALFNTSEALINDAANQNSFSSQAGGRFEGDAQKSGVSYAFGVNLGKNLSEKWAVQTGLQYSYNESESSSSFIENYVVRSGDGPILPGSREKEGRVSLDRPGLTGLETYDFDNVSEFIAVPLQVSYTLFEEKKIGFMLSTGMSAEFLLKNKVKERRGLVKTVSFEGDSHNSPYRNARMNGLVGAELFYKVAKSYIFSLEPSYQQPLHSVTKDNSSFKSKPSVLRMGFRVKYLFN